MLQTPCHPEKTANPVQAVCYVKITLSSMQIQVGMRNVLRRRRDRPVLRRRRLLRVVGPALVVVAGLVLASLVDSAALSDAVVMALPDHVRIRWQCKNALDSFPKWTLAVGLQATVRLVCTYRILTFLPPSFFVQILNTSSPLRTLTTAPQTSSPASANWSPIIARRRSSQYLSATPFFNLIIHLPPFLFSSSSHTGRMPSRKKW